jgi:hypothetical protein
MFKSMFMSQDSDTSFSSGYLRPDGRQPLPNRVTSELPVIRPESAISSKRTIVLPTRLTCCFPKGSVPPFLLETKMAVL